MRLRATAICIVLAMLVPVATAAAGPLCAGQQLVKGDCCCDDLTADDAAEAPALEASCCCELDQAPADRSTPESVVLSAESEPVECPSSSLLPWVDDQPTASGIVPPAHARGPPPNRTLFAQRTALIR